MYNKIRSSTRTRRHFYTRLISNLYGNNGVLYKLTVIRLPEYDNLELELVIWGFFVWHYNQQSIKFSRFVHYYEDC